MTKTHLLSAVALTGALVMGASAAALPVPSMVKAPAITLSATRSLQSIDMSLSRSYGQLGAAIATDIPCPTSAAAPGRWASQLRGALLALKTTSWPMGAQVAAKELQSALATAAWNATTRGQGTMSVNGINAPLLMHNAAQVRSAERALEQALKTAG